LIERNPPPWEGFLFEWVPNEKPEGRGSLNPILFEKIGVVFQEGFSSSGLFIRKSPKKGNPARGRGLL